jgi:small subunit ribosomal protein S16
VAVKIRLRRVGKVHAPYYRIVVTDSRTKRDGRFIEQIGKYHPKDDPSFIEVDSERAQYWLGVGAQPSDPVRAILRKTGDWQKFKGEPAPEPLLVPKSRRDRDAAFNEALKESGAEPKDDATTPKRSRKKADSKKKADAPSADTASEATASDEAATDEAASDEAASDEAKPATDDAAAKAETDTAKAEADSAEPASEASDDASTS